jgi:hypothetical protein
MDPDHLWPFCSSECHIEFRIHQEFIALKGKIIDYGMRRFVVVHHAAEGVFAGPGTTARDGHIAQAWNGHFPRQHFTITDRNRKLLPSLPHGDGFVVRNEVERDGFKISIFSFDEVFFT